MITVKEFTKQRDEWIFANEGYMRLCRIALQVGLSESRVKQILARMRKAKKIAQINRKM